VWFASGGRYRNNRRMPEMTRLDFLNEFYVRANDQAEP
jgi:hypothetical protein